MRFIYLFIALLFSSPLFAQFSPVEVVLDNILTRDFEIVDLDGDGDLDIVGINLVGTTSLATNFFWSENTDGQGTMSVPKIIRPDERQGHLTTGDIDGDGDIDLMTNKQTSFNSRYQWYENLGNASSFIERTNGPFAPSSSAHVPELVDLDGDGDLDVFSFSTGTTNNLSISWNENTDGLGNFNGIQSLVNFTGDSSLVEVQRADFDGDNDWDILAMVSHTIGAVKSNHLIWFEQTGNLSFSNSKYLTQLYSTIVTYTDDYFLVDDITGNGFPDILVHQDTFISIYENTGDPSNLSAPQTVSDDKICIDFELNDMDNDGDLDIVLACSSTVQAASWLENKMETNEWIQHQFPDQEYYHSIRFGDINNDGQEDLILGYSITGSAIGMAWYPRLDASGTFDERQMLMARDLGIRDLIPVDLDQDNDIDLISFANNPPTISWYQNEDPEGSFGERNVLLNLPFEVYKGHVVDVNQDGKEDLVYLIDDPNSNKYHLYWSPQSTASFEFLTPQLIDTDLAVSAFRSADMDNDGDLDLIVPYFPEGIFWLEYSAGTNDFVKHLIEDQSYSGVAKMYPQDVEGDGDIDLVFSTSTRFYWIENLGGIDNFAAAIQLNAPSFFGPMQEQSVGDHDGDGDLDIYGARKSNGSQINDQVYLFLFDQDSGTYMDAVEIPTKIEAKSMQVADLDGDGFVDIMGDNGWLKNLEGTGYSQLFEMEPDDKNFIHLVDLNGDNDLDVLYTLLSNNGIYYQDNQLDTVTWVRGNLFADFNTDCEPTDSTEIGLANWPINYESSAGPATVPTLSDGQFIFYVNEPGDYTISVIPQSAYWINCFNDSLLQINEAQDIYYLDWPVQPIVECPLVLLDIDTWGIRTCVDNRIQISYCNLGTQNAEEVTIEILLDEFVTLEDTDIPPTTITDSSYIFNLAEPLGIGACGQFDIYIKPDCDTFMLDDIVCVQGHITPDTLCLPENSSWDGSTIEVTGYCIEDSIVFELKNIGWGDMSEVRTYESFIVNDDIVMLHGVGNFNLDAGGIKQIVVPSEGLAMRLEAKQDPQHPLPVNPGILVNDCEAATAGLGLTLFSAFPDHDGDPFSENFCRPITGSYDPNNKTARPTGLGTQHFIEKDWELDYQIRFQNTGNDTAFLVVIRDTLSENLDLSSLRVGTASHPFTWTLSTDRVLTFTFDNILLPDSTTNLLQSQGFVKYEVTPNADLLPLSLIENRAGIYFDFNDPIITNTVFHTIRKPIVGQAAYIDLCAGDSYGGFIPTTDTLLIDTFSTILLDSFVFNYIHLLDTSHVQIDTQLIAGNMWNGSYVLSDTVIIDSLVNMAGCDSLIIVNIELLTSISSPLAHSSIVIYPNPSKGQITIEQLENQNQINIHSVRLFNTQGQEQFYFKGPIEQRHQFNLAHIKSGVYWLKLQTDDGPLIQRLLLYTP